MSKSSVVVAPTGQRKRTTRGQRYLVCSVYKPNDQLVIHGGTNNLDYAETERSRWVWAGPTREAPFIWDRVERRVVG